MNEQHLNPHQLAHRWSLKYHTLERWRCDGFGPPFLKIGGRVLYRLSDIEAYEAANIFKETPKDEGIPVRKISTENRQPMRVAS